jgi:hypothetical protein
MEETLAAMHKREHLTPATQCEVVGDAGATYLRLIR